MDEVERRKAAHSIKSAGHDEATDNSIAAKDGTSDPFA
jgi:hypothetical protein